MKPTPDRRGERGIGVLAVMLLIVGSAAVIFVAAGTLADHRLNSARTGWNESLGSWDEIVERYPGTEANASALELERLAGALGVDIVPRHRDGRESPGAKPAEAFSSLKRSVFGEYMQRQIERAERGDLDLPPQALVAFMSDHESELLALRRHLLESPVPVWESDLSRGIAAPIPNLLGQIDLQKLLGNVALARAHAGDPVGAVADVEATWNLTRSIRDSPILICQLIAIAQTRLQAGVLRQLVAVPDEWGAKLQQHDFRRSFLTALKYEGRVWLEIGGLDGSAEASRNWWEITTGPAKRTYNKFCVADLSSSWRERMENFERVDWLCDYDLAAQQADLNIPIPRWNQLGKVMVPNLVHAVDRVARLELDLELTRLLLEAAGRAEDGDSWAELVGQRDSEACPQDRWRYSEIEGGLQIAFERDITWPEQRGAVLPTRVLLN